MRRSVDMQQFREVSRTRTFIALKHIQASLYLMTELNLPFFGAKLA